MLTLKKEEQHIMPEANPHECPTCNWQCDCGDSPCTHCEKKEVSSTPEIVFMHRDENGALHISAFGNLSTKFNKSTNSVEYLRKDLLPIDARDFIHLKVHYANMEQIIDDWHECAKDF